MGSHSALSSFCRSFWASLWQPSITRSRGAATRIAGTFPWLDVVLGTIALAAGAWVSVEYQRLLNDVTYYTPEIVGLSIILLPLVLEAVRRCTGWALLRIVIVFIVYALLAQYAPMVIRGKPSDFFPLMTYLALDTNAMLGTPLRVGAEVVVLFLFMGDMLIRAGGGEFFIDLARACLAAGAAAPPRSASSVRRFSARFRAARCPTSPRSGRSPSR